MRVYVAVLAYCLVGLSMPASPATASPPVPGNYYLALGDSLGYGYSYDGGPVGDPQCESPTAPGYVCVFFRYLKKINPNIQLQNLSVPGLDSCELIHGYGTPEAAAACPNAHSVPVSRLDAPLQTSLALIKAHPGEVSPITVDIGANDLTPLIGTAAKDPLGAAARLPGVFTRLRADLDTTLSTLRAAAPNAKIIISTQYNPLGGIGSPPLTSGLPDIAAAAIKSMNGIIVDEAAKNNVTVVDVAAAFDANPGGAYLLTYEPQFLASGDIGSGIHATPQGYLLWGNLLIQASGYVLPISISARLNATRVQVGKTIVVSGTTSGSAAVTLTIWPPHAKKRSATTTAAADGTFSRAFKAGKSRGKGFVRACAVDAAAQRKCSARMAYSVG